MSGVIAVNALLSADVTLTATVPADRIVTGPVEQGTVLPAIGIKQVSGVPRNTVSMAEPKRLWTDRVQVTAYSLTYDEMKQVLELVRLALPFATGTTNGLEVDSILPDLVGPEIFDPATGVHEQSRDFIVKWRALSSAPITLEDGGYILLE